MLISSPVYFSSLEELNESSHGWDTEFYALKAGDNQFSMERVQSQSTVATVAHFQGQTLRRGATPKGFRTFGFTLGATGNFYWHGHSVGRDSLMCFGNDGALDAVSPDALSVCAVSISQEIADSFLEEIVGKPVLECAKVTDFRRAEKGGLKSAIVQFSQYLATMDPEHPIYSRQLALLEEDIQYQLQLTLGHGVGNGVVFSPRSYQLVRKALDYIRENLHAPIRVTELAADLDISLRTLELCFKKHLHLSPKMAISQMRLAAVRCQLLQARASDHLVGTIAHDWGYWHLGHFATDYRKAFAESPSHTLARTV